MKLTFDTDTLLYQVLIASSVASAITGGIYKNERPDNSDLEDIVINTIDLGQEYIPQTGTSNVNIHVKDLDVIIGGVQQKKSNSARLKTLSDLIVSTLRNHVFTGVGMTTIEWQAVIAEPEISQHYSNIRIKWLIHS